MRVVFTHHGADYRRLKWGLVARTILRLGEQLAVRCSHATIAVAPSLAADLRSRYPAAASRISYIPNGTPSCGPGDCAKLLAELAVRPKDFILTVGRLVPEKGFDLLVEAHRRSGTRRKLVVVGAADHESEFSRALMKKASDDVIFTGALPREVVHALYAQAGLFVLPSFHEGLPIAALEAGSAGCPMLLSDIEPHLDLALPPENYFAAGDTGALSECLKSDPARFQVDKEAFRAFDWDQIAPATLSVYEATLRG
jgi:glycosyltransferase involved in cell wall biosynthesis